MLNQRLVRRALIPVVVITSFVGLLLGPSQAMANVTTKTLSTNFTLVNFGSATANVQVAYYKTDGSQWVAAAGNTTFTIPGNGGQKPVYQYLDSTLSPGQGSAVVSSDQPLGGVVQILARNQTPTSGAYAAVAPAPLLYAPLILRNQPTASGTANTQIVIQNAGTSTLTGTTVQFVNSAGATVYTSPRPSLAPGASDYYDVSNDNNLAAPFAGSAIVNAGAGSISVVVNVFIGPDSLQTYSAIPSTSLTNAYGVPLFNSRLANGLSTVVSAQNLSGGTIAAGAVHLDCNAFAGSAAPSTLHLTNPASMNNGQSYSFNPVVNLAIPALWYGACQLTSSGNIAAIIQMRVIGSANADSYDAFPSSSTDKTFFAPLVQNRLSNGAATNTTITNLNTGSVAHVTVTYTPSPDYVAAGGSSAILSTSTTIPAGSSLQQNNRVQPFTVGASTMPLGWFGTLKVVSSDQPIAGFTQLTNVNNPPGDTFMTFGDFTQP